MPATPAQPLSGLAIELPSEISLSTAQLSTIRRNNTFEARRMKAHTVHRVCERAYHVQTQPKLSALARFYPQLNCAECGAYDEQLIDQLSPTTSQGRLLSDEEWARAKESNSPPPPAKTKSCHSRKRRPSRPLTPPLAPPASQEEQAAKNAATAEAGMIGTIGMSILEEGRQSAARLLEEAGLLRHGVLTPRTQAARATAVV